MRIGIVLYPTFGGSGVLATELGMALANEGHQVHFITYSQPVRLATFNANIFYHEVRINTYPLFDYPPYESALSSTIVDVALNQNLDILHVHYAIPHALSAFIAKKILQTNNNFNLPVITTLHGTDITLVGRDKTYEPVVTFSINQSDAITAVSQNLKQETINHFAITKDIEVINNFVDVSRFARKPIDAFKKTLAPNGERVITHASNFRRIKRVNDIIAMFNKLRNSIPAKLMMVGDGPERFGAEELCRNWGIESDVRFVGKQEQMEDILAISDLFVLPSEYESFGLSALEAMAASVPVLSSDAGGLPEINIQGETGYLAPVGNIEKMTEYAEAILQNDESLSQFKQKAFEQAKRFDIMAIVPQYESLYEKVVAGVNDK